ncbi:MAG: 50S ribosomal protein L22 [Armatimonadetes bacterium]|nr:50S ribosomal protein L22 [Armatimonadota bacterium]
MEVRATAKWMRVPPRKARLVARHLKGKHAVRALAELRYHPAKSARLLSKVIRSAVGNAVENEELSPDTLVISRIVVNEGFRFKRLRPRAMGRANRIAKRTSHITVILEPGEPFEVRRSNAKPKPRPKFEAPKPQKPQGKADEAEVGREAVEEPTEEQQAAERAQGAETESEETAEGEKAAEDSKGSAETADTKEEKES